MKTYLAALAAAIAALAGSSTAQSATCYKWQVVVQNKNGKPLTTLVATADRQAQAFAAHLQQQYPYATVSVRARYC